MIDSSRSCTMLTGLSSLRAATAASVPISVATSSLPPKEPPVYACTTRTIPAGTPRFAAICPRRWKGDWQEAYTVTLPSGDGTAQTASGSMYPCSWCEVSKVPSTTRSASAKPFSTSPFTSFFE